MYDDPDDLDGRPIGYRSPPTYTRFPKGRSGNPKGRPRKKPEQAVEPASKSDDILRRELARPVRVTEGGKSTEISKQELVVRAEIASAAKGNVWAQREINKRAQELEARDAAREQAEVEVRYLTYAHVKRWRDAQIIAWRGVSAGRPEPVELWPHPDDIILGTDGLSWRIRGPGRDGFGLPFYSWCRAERDALLFKAFVDGRRRKPSPKSLSQLWMVLAFQYDARLPRRWQLRDDDDYNLALLSLFLLPDLKWLADRARERADLLQISACLPLQDKEVYREVNAIMKPLLQRQGYRSLAQFEHEYERRAKGGNMRE